MNDSPRRVHPDKTRFIIQFDKRLALLPSLPLFHVRCMSGASGDSPPGPPRTARCRNLQMGVTRHHHIFVTPPCRRLFNTSTAPGALRLGAMKTAWTAQRQRVSGRQFCPRGTILSPGTPASRGTGDVPGTRTSHETGVSHETKTSPSKNVQRQRQ